MVVNHSVDCFDNPLDGIASYVQLSDISVFMDFRLDLCMHHFTKILDLLFWTFLCLITQQKLHVYSDRET